jgi:hypothetical protein
MTRTHPAAGREWLLDLEPGGPVAISSAASSASTVAETIMHVGEEPVRWAIEVGHGMATTITREIPVFGGGEGPSTCCAKGRSPRHCGRWCCSPFLR